MSICIARKSVTVTITNTPGLLNVFLFINMTVKLNNPMIMQMYTEVNGER